MSPWSELASAPTSSCTPAGTALVSSGRASPSTPLIQVSKPSQSSTGLHWSLDLMRMAGEDEAGVLSTIRSPQYFMATPDSDESCRPGGLAEQIIERTVFEEFETPCDHGFFNRGDLSDPTVAACVETALENLKHFLIGNM